MPPKSLFARCLMAASLMILPLTASRAEVKVEHIKVHSQAVEGNLEGNSADRDVIVFLPEDYATSTKRYPVVYFLHGFMGSAEGYDKYIGFADALNTAEAKNRQAILVVPDSNSRHGGSMYSSSPTTGNFERFIAQDLVAYVDKHYRTLAKQESRGLSGHSMGGYGTLRIAMKYPGVFSSIYAMSACCLSARPVDAERSQRLEAMSMDEALKGDFGVRADFAAASAWSPAPDKAPFYLDLGTQKGVVQPQIIAQWAANAPLAMAPQYLPALKSLKAIAIDVGDKDTLIKDNGDMARLLDRMGVAHSYTVYEGDHGNRVRERFRAFVLPFFAEHLAKD
ncbi:MULTISPECIES: alpha/beta hydrolase [unclassified Sphingobium]|uniref:alpha/beta hydrolase n=1 Tax=unclassified Sphingobium TaxID=2611147 RepID=UPI002225A535|nr:MULTISPECIES: alpha/beta hydrolase [unclassified Sphingobium]MCW2382653.1 enterochelin esterase-like enzyme [Sphingobium sp. B2D3B]MCW2397174.1 enterochelin esterase-like enzyme [Sphingobium sp. B2D3C]